MKLTLIDESTINAHSYINSDDECHFASNYISNVGGYKYGGTNQLIYNFKIKPDKRGTDQWKHKKDAIKKVSEMFKANILNTVLQKVTLVPIPPSKSKKDPLYDDRLIESLNIAFGKKADIRELLEQVTSKKASHETDIRPTIKELYDNLTLIDSKCIDLKQNIILVDDVLTTGAHFKACKQKILEKFPEINVVGVFVARREFENNNKITKNL